MSETGAQAGNLKLLGGRLCLDFINTIDPRAGEEAREYLTSYAELVAWSRHTNILADRQARHLIKEAARRTQDAALVLKKAITLREAIYRIFLAIANERQPNEGDLTELNNALSEALAQLRIAPGAAGFVYVWNGDRAALDRMLWPVAQSAGELLTSDELNRVRECPGDKCGWLFMDLSRNNSRRWCDMNVCGNRAKSRRHYQRIKSKSS